MQITRINTYTDRTTRKVMFDTRWISVYLMEFLERLNDYVDDKINRVVNKITGGTLK